MTQPLRPLLQKKLKQTIVLWLNRDVVFEGEAGHCPHSLLGSGHGSSCTDRLPHSCGLHRPATPEGCQHGQEEQGRWAHTVTCPELPSPTLAMDVPKSPVGMMQLGPRGMKTEMTSSRARAGHRDTQTSLVQAVLHTPWVLT